MPITLPVIDDRQYQDLLEEAIARIPVHTPEWTNFNQSDPGITIIEVFAFLTESLLYRANLIPERNRKKFLKLVGVGLQPEAPAQGLLQIRNDNGPLEVRTMEPESEVAASQIRFRTTRGLDVLPIEGRIYAKHSVAASADVLEYYQELYASFRGAAPSIVPSLYDAQPFPSSNGATLSLSDTVDHALWLGLFARKPEEVDQARNSLGGKILTLGVVPVLTNAEQRLAPGERFGAFTTTQFVIETPLIDATLLLPTDRVPRYRALQTQANVDLLSVPGVIDAVLPAKEELTIWQDIDPLEGGTDSFPPVIDDPKLDARLITWLRIRPATAVDVNLRWAGINCVPIEQRSRVFGEVLPNGTGEPDQVVRLAQAPVVPGSVNITITDVDGKPRTWHQIDDLFNAGPEVPTTDPRLPVGTPPPPPADPQVFLLNAESGEIVFGDGMRGARPRRGVSIRATYDESDGSAGNLGASQVKKVLERGFEDLTADNPIPTWGGVDAETVEAGERQISRQLKNRDRLVTLDDFEAITLRTPGVSLARVEVQPNFHPDLPDNIPGDVPGVVTLMVIPKQDPGQPDAPRPDRLFLSTICDYLDARRLITTEIFVRGPVYRGIWVSIGIKAASGRNEANVREAVKAAVSQFLAPSAGQQQLGDEYHGWPLRKSVIALELAAVVGRAAGVEFVQEVLLAADDGVARQAVPMSGLNLPRLLGLSVTSGAAVPLDQMRGTTPVSGTGSQGPRVVQIPAIPEVCR